MVEERHPTTGDEYRHPDGTVEVVFAVEGGRVLTFREYRDESAFRRSVEAATYEGVHEEVANLPDAAAFRETKAASDTGGEDRGGE